MGVMAMKGFFTLSRSPELEPHHQMQFSVIPKTSLFGRLAPLQEIQSVADIVDQLQVSQKSEKNWIFI